MDELRGKTSIAEDEDTEADRQLDPGCRELIAARWIMISAWQAPYSSMISPHASELGCVTTTARSQSAQLRSALHSIDDQGTCLRTIAHQEAVVQNAVMPQV